MLLLLLLCNSRNNLLQVRIGQDACLCVPPGFTILFISIGISQKWSPERCRLRFFRFFRFSVIFSRFFLSIFFRFFFPFSCVCSVSFRFLPFLSVSFRFFPFLSVSFRFFSVSFLSFFFAVFSGSDFFLASCFFHSLGIKRDKKKTRG